jgi:shikimate kinase
MNVALVGYRGCGKSTLGKRLADKLWEKFIDIDDVIVRKEGKTIKDIFEQLGEDYYRDVETSCLIETLQNKDFILALGGGTLIRPENRQMVREWAGKIIYLRCDPQVLLERIQSDPMSRLTRPSLTSLGGGIEEIRIKLSEREPIYNEVKDAELDVTNLTPDEAVSYLSRMI